MHTVPVFQVPIFYLSKMNKLQAEINKCCSHVNTVITSNFKYTYLWSAINSLTKEKLFELNKHYKPATER